MTFDTLVTEAKFYSKILYSNHIINPDNYMFSIGEIARMVSAEFNLHYSDFIVKTRKRRILEPRQITYAICRAYSRKHELSWSLKKMAATVGMQDHATVLHASKNVTKLMETDKRFCDKVERVALKFGIDKHDLKFY
jgi:chromosomal replication initiator protein